MIVDLTGKVFGRLTAVSFVGKIRKSGHFWKCLCACGNEAFIRGANLRGGRSESCGCIKKERVAAHNRSRRVSIADFQGKTFSKWTVLAEAPPRNGKTVWVCRCECGAVKAVQATSLRSGRAKSCGHRVASKKTEVRAPRLLAHPSLYILFPAEYRAWGGMKTRCTNEGREDWPHYGGRGIKVCERWFSSFENFLSDMGPRPSDTHSLDRIDVDGDYEPGNVRWASTAQQSVNRRNNRRIVYRGRSVALTEAIIMAGNVVTFACAHSRVNRGWPHHDAVEMPSSTKRLKQRDSA